MINYVRLLVLEGDVAGEDAAVGQRLGHVRMARAVVHHLDTFRVCGCFVCVGGSECVLGSSNAVQQPKTTNACMHIYIFYIFIYIFTYGPADEGVRSQQPCASLTHTHTHKPNQPHTHIYTHYYILYSFSHIYLHVRCPGRSGCRSRACGSCAPPVYSCLYIHTYMCVKMCVCLIYIYVCSNVCVC